MKNNIDKPKQRMNHFFQISHNKEIYTQPIYFHSHDFYEIYFFMDGNVKYYIENESYTLKKGDILIIPPGKIHRPVIEEGNAPYERYVLWLYSHYISSKDGLGEIISEINDTITEKNTRLIPFKGNFLHHMTELFDKLHTEFLSEANFSFYIAESCITLILTEILRTFEQMDKVSDEPQELIRRVIAYINANVMDAPSLEELSEVFFVSKYYLSHKFKEYTKTTIHQYILMKKINLAKELLEKGNSPKEVCDLCGFSTYSNFYKAFTSQTGISPKDYNGKQFTIHN